MLNLIRKWFGLCEHKWTIIREISVLSEESRHYEIPIGSKFVLQCTKCGDIKTKKTY